jgi:hypothetical protein
MGSRMFRAIDKNMRRSAWMQLIELEWEMTRKDKFRATLVGNPYALDAPGDRQAPPAVDWDLPRALDGPLPAAAPKLAN